jgi:hypothetical protein
MSVELFSQAPTWTNYSARLARYPEAKYYSGFTTEQGVKTDNEKVLSERAINSAKALLVQSVTVTIESNSSIIISNVNTKTNEVFNNNTSSYSKLDMTNLKEQQYFDAKKHIAYAYVYIEKSALTKLYTDKITILLSELKNKRNLAESFLKTNQRELAYEAYFKCYPVMRNIENAQSVLFFTGTTDTNVLRINESYQLTNEIEIAVSQIKNLKQASLDDLCYFFTEALIMQLPDDKKSIMLSNFTFQDTKMGSTFSRKLTQVLEQKLSTGGKLSVFRNDGDQTLKADYVIRGTYWDESDQLKVIAVVNEIATGKIIASVEGTLDKSWISKNGIAYKPENFGQAMENMQVMKQDEIINGGLNIDLWTNQGQENLLYSKGDTLQLYVKANKECYVRLVYYLASGEKVLLLENYYVGSDMLNRIVKVPYRFICDAPYGAEILQMNAQTKQFSPLKTKRESGYEFIESDINEILKNVRGFKRIDDENLNAEKRVLITTLGKQ